ncbi:UDP-N-acetylglucosamine 2-epimerase (non-hydrolyzing) [Candidatus Bathyarchaeota archaeon]|nr:MAG: UDP-N-acetylglucosamine 2-epimerase (non-hydrolyzing) [Candidatus Bathyarchaeota archaeon]
MKIAIILGTRPELIKMSPIIMELEKQNLDYFILHTGQHYSYSLDKVFFEELGLPEPKYNLMVGSGTHAEETSKIMVGVEKILLREKPDIVLVEGDTNTVLAGALAAVKLKIVVGHVEAGLRSYDRKMPEEINRILTDHVSDMLFTPTLKAKYNLLKEGISEARIFITGNTIVDALIQNLKRINDFNILDKLGIHQNDYFLVTLHREENVDDRKRLSKILEGLTTVHKEFDMPVIFPIHPRTKKRMEEFNLNPKGLILIEPLGYLDFLKLESKARLVLTDSGGIQEEACVLKVPCVTLRDSTERPETIEVGANMLTDANPKNILEKVGFMLKRSRNWENPLGDGKAGRRIVEILVGWKSG